jgi:hypothetical protein
MDPFLISLCMDENISQNNGLIEGIDVLNNGKINFKFDFDQDGEQDLIQLQNINKPIENKGLKIWYGFKVNDAYFSKFTATGGSRNDVEKIRQIFLNYMKRSEGQDVERFIQFLISDLTHKIGSIQYIAYAPSSAITFNKNFAVQLAAATNS